MLHMNPGDDRENTLENLRELVENCYHDVFVTYRGEAKNTFCTVIMVEHLLNHPLVIISAMITMMKC